MTPEQYQQVKEIYYSALEREPAERAEYLSDVCNGDGELIREVESLLEHQPRADKFIERSAFEVGARLISDEQADSLEGQRLGQYKLIKRIGSGGMGLVYLAERADEQFQKQVAIKIVRFGLDTAETQRRFRYERQILATLDHPNIAKLLDAGTTEGGLPYLVMDYVEGAPINRYCDEHKLSMNERLRLFRIVCSAVQFAHQRLVIHRDLKPGNMLVNEDGTPKLLDFGIAKLLDPASMDATAHTQTGARVMTPEYASPEQVRGEAVTTATDTYSLGVLLYELLSGRRPYRITGSRQDEIARAICEQEPSKPSQAVSGQWSVVGGRPSRAKPQPTTANEPKAIPQSAIRNPKFLRGDLDNIVLKAMHKEPQRRYSSVEQFSEDIRRYLEGLPVIARPDTFSYRAGKFIRRHKYGATAVALVLVSLIAGIIATTSQTRRANEQARLAAIERDKAQQQAIKAQRIDSFMGKILSYANPSWYAEGKVRGGEEKVIQAIDDLAGKIETEFPNEPEIRAELHHRISDIYRARYDYQKAYEHALAALETRKQIYGENHAEVAKDLYYLSAAIRLRALYRQNQDDFDESERLLREAIAMMREVDPHNINLPYMLLDLGTFQLNADQDAGQTGAPFQKLSQRDVDQAERSYKEAASLFADHYGKEHVTMAIMLVVFGELAFARNDLSEAERLLNEGLRREKSLDEKQLQPDALYQLCRVKTSQGDYSSAENLCNQALADLQQAGGRRGWPDIGVYNALARLYELKGDRRRSVTEAEHAMTIREQVANDGR